MARWWIGCLVGLYAAGARAGELSGRLRAQLGQEYDTNAERASGSSSPADFLTRLVLEGTLGLVSGPHRFGLEYQGGAKLFYQKTDENLLANRLLTSYRYHLASGRSVGVRLGLRDVSQLRHSRDYLQLRAEAFLGLRPFDRLSLEVYSGARHYTFKPDSKREDLRYSHLGPELGLRCRIHLGSSWSAGLSYHFDVRFFDYAAKRKDDLQAEAGGSHRQDLRHVAGLRMQFQTHWWREYRLFARSSYFISYNDSNSYGSSAFWHRLQAVLSLQLPLDLIVHLLGSLQVTDFPDGLYLDSDYYEPDADENENSLVIRLTYRMWQELDLVLQAAIYRNDFHLGEQNPSSFERETLMLGLEWSWSD